MGRFTFVPVWVIQDAIVYVFAFLIVIYYVKKERHPEVILTELACFVFLYATVYENFATYVATERQLYGYGRSLISIFNVPLSVPIFEYLVVYASLKLLNTMKIPTWCKPLVVGMFAILVDLSLDPVAIKQVFHTAEGTTGRWTWFLGPNDAQIFGEPVFNFTGWALICGWGAAFLLVGRAWFTRSGEKPFIGYLYPLLGMLAALVLIVSPVSNFLLWLAPIFQRGSSAEWVMLAFFLILPGVLLLTLWRGRMRSGMSLKRDYPIFVTLGGFHVVNILFSVIGGYWSIIPLQAAAALAECALLAAIYVRGRTLARTHNRVAALGGGGLRA
jgi:hypothetical protein